MQNEGNMPEVSEQRPTRDPRVEPRVGDYLISKAGRQRTVLDISDRTGMIQFQGSKRYAVLFTRIISLKAWRKWAKDAEVIHVAD